MSHKLGLSRSAWCRPIQEIFTNRLCDIGTGAMLSLRCRGEFVIPSGRERAGGGIIDGRQWFNILQEMFYLMKISGC